MFISLLKFKVLTAFYENPPRTQLFGGWLVQCTHRMCASQSTLFADKSVLKNTKTVHFRIRRGSGAFPKTQGDTCTLHSTLVVIFQATLYKGASHKGEWYPDKSSSEPLVDYRHRVQYATIYTHLFFTCSRYYRHWDRYTRVTADRENWNRGERRR